MEIQMSYLLMEGASRCHVAEGVYTDRPFTIHQTTQLVSQAPYLGLEGMELESVLSDYI